MRYLRLDHTVTDRTEHDWGAWTPEERSRLFQFNLGCLQNEAELQEIAPTPALALAYVRAGTNTALNDLARVLRDYHRARRDGVVG